MKKPVLSITVSVVIPCYNVARWVGDAVQSCLDQTQPPLEIILVDDGSTDETLPILREFEVQWPDKVQVIAASNQGAPAARNKGLNIARGDYIQFLDADDYLLPEKLTHQIECLQKHGGNADLIVGNFFRENENKDRQIVRYCSNNPWIGLIQTQLGITSANLWRTKLVRDVGGWNESLRSSQEYDLMFRILKSTQNILFAPESLTVIREREGSISRSSHTKINNWIRYLELRKSICDYLDKNKLLNEQLQSALHCSFFSVIRHLYADDPKLALKYYGELIPSDFIPPAPTLHSKIYSALYRNFGFTRAEKLRQLLGGR